MERLTHYLRDGRTAAEPKNRAEGLAFAAKLAAYEDAEENGTLIKLPCKVGDTVYGIMRFYKRSKIAKEEVINLTVDHFTIGYSGAPIMTVCGGANDWYDYYVSDAGTGFFLTREEAEAALKERESE